MVLNQKENIEGDKMMKITQKIVILPNAPAKFKREVTSLLKQLMKDYRVTGEDKEWEDAFKNTFKSNLYYLIDNYYKVIKNKK